MLLCIFFKWLCQMHFGQYRVKFFHNILENLNFPMILWKNLTLYYPKSIWQSPLKNMHNSIKVVHFLVWLYITQNYVFSRWDVTRINERRLIHSSASPFMLLIVTENCPLTSLRLLTCLIMVIWNSFENANSCRNLLTCREGIPRCHLRASMFDFKAALMQIYESMDCSSFSLGHICSHCTSQLLLGIESLYW